MSWIASIVTCFPCFLDIMSFKASVAKSTLTSLLDKDEYAIIRINAP